MSAGARVLAVEIKRAVHLGVGKDCWIEAGFSQKVECDERLREELVT